MNRKSEPPSDRALGLPRGLEDLREIIAENVHNTWARQRSEEGWCYGAERDDSAKTHPDLVPYAQLADSERDYDRLTAWETLQTILRHGYRIVGPDDSVERSGSAYPVPPTPGANEYGTHAIEMERLLRQTDAVDLISIVAKHKSVPLRVRWSNRSNAQLLIQYLLERNEPILAFDFVSEALESFPNEVRLMQLQGLSLARAGATLHANQIFQQLRDAGHRDEETLGNLARTYKTLWEYETDAIRKQSYLNRAFDAYRYSYQATSGYWSGVNVAFLALIRGDEATASTVAKEVEQQCKELIDQNTSKSSPNYWVMATIAEAALIQGKLDSAVHWYKRATKSAGQRFGNIASTFRQARVLAHHRNIDWYRLSPCFPLPKIVVFAQPSERLAEMPVAMIPLVKKCVSAFIQRHSGLIAFGTLESDWERLFLEAVVDSGGEIHVLQDGGKPVAQPTEFDGDPVRRKLLHKSEHIHTVTACAGQSSEMADQYSANVLRGLAMMRAKQFGADPSCVTLSLSENPIAVEIKETSIDEEGLGMRQTNMIGPIASRTIESLDECIVDHQPTVMSLLFADVKGFSRLNESQLVAFAKVFLGTVSECMRDLVVQPNTKHTWGDGLYFTFEKIQDAGRYALRLADAIGSVPWARHGLPVDLGIRIGLHAGPVYGCYDPISQQLTYFGIHVNHAARIEPVTPPGNVYASESFAALAAHQKNCSFQCEYVGQTPLAKDFGMFATYHLRSATSS
ncbi:TRAFs-binding domain-containing protein [Novipirellula artificiosorum]|uniref:RyR domain protein n=1 Tax=Novipirellula artificiosorum TaxID=2528016 RepID=A0A5C6D3E7_9BACT|nr:TRAFs-binding domain-containing protein [Novipirellula artificiosorum]TWU31320.1 RyR domain protein [Novipirellula artificiosorum]